MAGRAKLANDAWESLLTVHAIFMKSLRRRAASGATSR